MKIGYPCINRSIECKGSKTFRLASYSENRLKEVVDNNLNCLLKMLKYNVSHNILFFRISSDIVPFASHPVCTFKWGDYFKSKFNKIGKFIKNNKIRISMHPDQFILINTPYKDVLERSVKELLYHSNILDFLNLDKTAKIQLHVGGAYKNKEKSKIRFIENYKRLSQDVKKRLVIENDDRIYSFKDCLDINEKIKIPILFDYFHDSINSSNMKLTEMMEIARNTWQKKDGLPMVDYSSQNIEKRTGSHTNSIDVKKFKKFIKNTIPYNFDIMLEIKDKEKSAIKAVKTVYNDKRFVILQKKILKK